MKRKAFLLSVLALCFLPVFGQEESFSGYEVSDEAAWCWFADPRAMYDTVNDKAYLGYIDVHGSVKAAQRDADGAGLEEVLVRSEFQPDDHNNPTFLRLPDGRVMIFYMRHTDEAKFYYRISTVAGDITRLGAEKSISVANNTTYPSPFILESDPEHIYLMWRGIGWHPTIARLTMPDANDDVTIDYGPYQMVQSTGARPYAKYFSNGKDKIYVAYTTGHPDNEYPNWLYMNVIDVSGSEPVLKDLKGNTLKTISEGTFAVSKTSTYKSSYPNTIIDAPTGYRDWVWQIALDEDENPVVAMVRISNDKNTHHYYYAHWDGSAWTLTYLANGGGKFHSSSTEYCYSGGMTLDTEDVGTVYLSLPVDGVWEIWKYVVDADGKVSDKEAITYGSEKNNVRPWVLPGSKGQDLRLCWMSGDYYYWMVNKNYPKGYPTGLRSNVALKAAAKTSATPVADALPAADLSSDGGFDVSVGSSSNAFTIIANISLDADNYGDTLLSGAGLTYSVPTNYKPQVTVGETVYASSNALLTSDESASLCGGTDGKWYPTKLEEVTLALTYDGTTLTVYRNGLIDQRFDVEGLALSDLHFGEAGGVLNGITVYDVCLAQQEVVSAQEEQALAIETERVKNLSTELENWDFEAAYETLHPTGLATDRAVHQPEKWTLTRTSGNENDLTALCSADQYYDSFFASLDQLEDGGEHTYWVRQKWGTSTISLSQEVLLSEGKYTLTADVWKSGLGGDALVDVVHNGTTTSAASLENKTAWQEVSIDFESDGVHGTKVVLTALHNNAGYEKIIGFDNIVVTKTGEADAISAVTAEMKKPVGMYALDGRRLAVAPTHGVFIENGEKKVR